MARSHGRGRKRGGGGAHEESGERWLLTYADMITLLMALFMVLFSISSVNISKIQSLQESLRAAFSGNILPGGKAIAKPGSTANASHAPTATPLQAIVPISPQSVTNPEAATHSSSSSSASAGASSAAQSTSTNVAAAAREQSNFEHLKHELDAYAASHGFARHVNTTIESRGLAIRVLTDSLLFPSGSATLDPQGEPLLDEIAKLLNVDEVHPIAVEGNTDDVPVHSSTFPSNWELSTARASTVVRFLISNGVQAARLSAVGYASLRPIASNSTPEGRALNRRVEIVLQRIY
ncbi:MAG TPA: flagellar motor protein MotB [Solirubrobacteraceae bacterium]|jgi:chemotaxis protein MotB|nr:flagellar motor protein MotB [Solirubrobacteraceae bacterium]